MIQGQTWFDEITVTVSLATALENLLTPMEAHRDKIPKHTGIEVVFTRSIIEYRIHGEECVCCLTTSLSRDSNQGLRYE